MSKEPTTASPPSERALTSRLDPDEELRFSFVTHDETDTPDAALPSGRSGEAGYRFGRTGTAYVFLDGNGEYRRIPHRTVRSTELVGSSLPRSQTAAAVVLGVCLLAFAMMVRFTAPQWWYLLWLSGFGTLAAVGFAGAQARWRPRYVFRIVTDGKDRIELAVPRNARHNFVEGEDEGPETGGVGLTPERFDLADILLGRRVSGVVLTVGAGVAAVGCAWLLLLWWHPLGLDLAVANPPEVAFVLAGAGTVAMAFRANRGLVPTTFPPLAVGVAVRHYNCGTLSVFYNFHVDCFSPGDPKVVLGIAASLWVLGLGAAIGVEGVTFVAEHVRKRLSNASFGHQ